MAYPLAVLDPPVRLPKVSAWHWRVKFRCPYDACARARAEARLHGPRVIGWLKIRKWLRPGGARMGPDGRIEPGTPVIPDEVGYLIETVFVAPPLRPEPNPPGGTPTFELPESARDAPFLPSRARAMPVLPSAGPTPFRSAGGDPYRAERGTPARKRGGLDFWSIALTGEEARGPFVVRCPDCRRRCRVNGSVPEDELRRLDELRAVLVQIRP